jgi:hypothetical protein
VVASNIDGPDPQIPADGFIQIAFDRYLLPDTVTRQSWLVLDANHQPLTTLGLKTTYDPIARTVTLSGPDGPGQPWLQPTQVYHLLLPVPPDDVTDQAGFRAIDRAPLAAPHDYIFRTTAETHQTTIEPKVDFCADVFPIFNGSCSLPTCHQGSVTDSGTDYSRPAQSLVLTTADGIQYTARGRVSQEANTGARSGVVTPPGSIFGIDMAIIEPGDPGASWLMYKVDLDRPPDLLPDGGEGPSLAPCFPAKGVPAVPPLSFPIQPVVAWRDADDAERAVLNDKVLGKPMPYPLDPDHPRAGLLTFQQRERIRAWIAQGAPIAECRGCGLQEAGAPETPDAAAEGGTDGGTKGDAGDAGDGG